MIFSKDLIVRDGKQLINQQTLNFYVSLTSLQSGNTYSIRLTLGQTNYYTSEFGVDVTVYDGGGAPQDITLNPKYLRISQSVDGNSTTKDIDIEDTFAYYYSSPYYQLLRHFYALDYSFREENFIQNFFSDCPDFTAETVIVTNPNVRCLPVYSSQFHYLQYYVQSSNFDLYLEPVDNSNQFQLLNSLNQIPGSHLTSDDYHDIIAIEAYNRNYLLAHLQPNVSGNLEISGDINASTQSSGGGSSVDLSGVVTQLQNISNKLTYTHSDTVTADLSELLYYVAEAIQYGLTYDDHQQIKHSFLEDLNKKLEYTQTIDDETVTKNITESLNEFLKTLDDNLDKPIIVTNEDLLPWSAV